MKPDYRGSQVEQRKPAAPSRPTWEYKSQLLERDADLSQFGAEGWECFQVIGAAADMAMFYFRRQR